MTNPLAKYRRVLLLTELMGIIHDVGKVDGGRTGKDNKHVGAYVNHVFVPFVEWNGNLEELKISDSDQYSQYNKPGEGNIFSRQDIDEKYKVRQELHLTLKDILPDYQDELVQRLFKEGKGSRPISEIPILHLFIKHHSNYFRYKGAIRPNSRFTDILSECDSMDSKEDRLRSANSDERKTQKVISVFGEDKCEHDHQVLEQFRLDVYKEIRAILMQIAALRRFENDEEIDQTILLAIHKKILALKSYLTHSAAMSVFPDNDSTVWDHSFMTGSIAKAKVANFLLQDSNQTRHVLSILAVQFPGRDLLTEVYRMPDFVGRAKLMEDIRWQVQNLIECEYSLGNLVYQDINGMYFIVPGLESLKKLDNLCEEIWVRIKELLDYGASNQLSCLAERHLRGLLVPFIAFKPAPREKKYFNFGKPIVELKREYETHLKRKLVAHRTDRLEMPAWCGEWKNAEHREICHVCRRMPVQHEAKERYQGDKLCATCSTLRAMGLQEGQKKQMARFVDQVMDENQKIVLLTGELGLFDLWLQGGYIFSTRYEAKGKQYPKKASPSRIRNVIEEADAFQQAVEKLVQSHANLRGLVPRFRLDAPLEKPGFWVHTFDQNALKAIIRAQFSKVVSPGHERFASWLDMICAQMGDTYTIYAPENSTLAEGVIAFGDFALHEWGIATQHLLAVIFREYFAVARLFSPEGGAERRNTLQIRLRPEIEWKEISKARKVYGMTDEFMYLLPANQAITIMQEIGNKFDKKFGRVKGRLSLNIGMIFADHKYPLYLVLDGGKRMLKEFREIMIDETIYKEYKAKVLKATLCTEDGKRWLEFAEPLQGDKIPYPLPEEVMVSPGVKRSDNYFGGVISLHADEHRILGAEKIAGLPDGHREPVLYTPDLVDFEYMDSIRSRNNITLRKKDQVWKKRKHQVWQLHQRPYTREQFVEFCECNRELNAHAVSATALKNLETAWINKLQRLFYTEEEYLEQSGLARDIALTLIMNIDSLKEFYTHLPAERREVWLEMVVDGRFFDLMELRTVLQAFSVQKEEV